MFDSATFLKNLTTQAGIYKMLNAEGEIIYIGKAKNLKNRVSSYFKNPSATPKQQVMVAKIAAVEVTVTETENEALLLECQQIKLHKPRYNICLRDDKSYPYIFLSNHEFPQISLHRGAKRKLGRYFGPYPSSGAARESLKLLQRLFPVRQCEESVYNNRTRPCLQHQIGRCTAPCVGLIDKASYALDVDNTVLFLEGKGGILIDQLVVKMDEAAAVLNFEQAARLRDQIARLRPLLESAFVDGDGGDMDIIACATNGAVACVQVFFIRGGQYLGNKVFFPKMVDEYDSAAVLSAFVPQYYVDKPMPRELIMSHKVAEVALLREALAAHAKHALVIRHKVTGERLKWLQMAVNNAENALLSRLADKQNMVARLVSLQQLLKCESVPKRLECFDISHTQGKQTVASCVVFDSEGANKSAYRRFNITGITGGDDAAAIHQAVFRRFKRLQEGEQFAPDIVFIDGSTIQVRAAQKALAELGINNVMIVGVAKGERRKSGLEKLIIGTENQPIDITISAGGLLIQQIRDEAHRFAITGHRQRRAKASKQSVLESVSGLGAKRRQLLLKQFGGLQGVASASVDWLCSIDGISRVLAQRIYDIFHHSDDHSI
ncbi:MAG: excinuclease ABC subunit UvrC [Methylococcales bacterium]|nr:excinuclease ABC subunit UvrC [Methylococcales bacterium]